LVVHERQVVLVNVELKQKEEQVEDCYKRNNSTKDESQCKYSD